MRSPYMKDLAMNKLLLAVALTVGVAASAAAQTQVSPNALPDQLSPGKYCKIVVGAEYGLAYIKRGELPGMVNFSSAEVTSKINIKGTTPQEAKVKEWGDIPLTRSGADWELKSPSGTIYVLNFTTYRGTATSGNWFTLTIQC